MLWQSESKTRLNIMRKIKQAFFFFPPAALKPQNIIIIITEKGEKKEELLPSCWSTGNLIAKVSSCVSEKMMHDWDFLMTIFKLSLVTPS